ncbi:hypothetical protein COY95_04850 [Candidatus Woesearchaeota archaeon CG_4_10_14_0_8_um_filter_47_5]|nr:MAG: hypothetical protein COY95_04850 [Candidatus Woesearchaeota archaeon CG_4_10_14_0_8_um_filter_47_5]
MEFSTIILIVFVLLGIVILAKLFKTVMKIVFIINLVLFLVLAFFTYRVVSDVNNFKESVEKQPLLFVLREGNNVSAVYRVFLGDVNGTSGETKRVQKLPPADKPYGLMAKEEDFSSLYGMYYKVMVVSSSIVAGKGDDAMMIFTEKLQNPVFLIEGIKTTQIKVYPETPLFSVMRILPASLLDHILVQKAGSDGTSSP